ncbi:MAG: hypothetical protein HN509_05570 [Halobacteriovoraceae bacterium]|jgi:hypothetical protein|nr:hypothetical protein [Halobacteriovoraceae bacterium]MBT5093262.1 hypothetical protein [Halobacteriovoraceae bacterium]
MRSIFVIITLSVLSFSLSARELTAGEKLVLTTLERTTKVRTYMQDNIRTEDLSFRQYLSFQLLKKSCLPLELTIAKIEKEETEYKDQSKFLLGLYTTCSEGTLSLSNLFIEQQ